MTQLLENYYRGILIAPVSCLAFSDLSLTCKARDGSDKYHDRNLPALINNNINMANQWFKFYGGEYLSDPKIGSLTGSERSCWITLMALASTSSIQGVIEFLDIRVLLEKSGIRQDNTLEWKTCMEVLDRFIRMKMIRIDDGVIQIINWNKRQEHTMTATERSRKSRALQGKKKQNETDATQCNENATLEENRIEENRDTEHVRASETEEEIGIEYTPQFLEFYKLYPRKIGKLGAFKKWETSVKKVGVRAIMEGLQKQLDTKSFDPNPKFIKHPQAWLNQGCWDDEVKINNKLQKEEY